MKYSKLFFFFFNLKKPFHSTKAACKSWFTSEEISELIMGGVSSIHVTKSSTHCAYLASPCAAMFPSLLVWQVSNWLNICMWCMVSAIILGIAGEGSDSPRTSKQTNRLSLSKITFWRLISLAKMAACSSTFASISQTHVFYKKLVFKTYS